MICSRTYFENFIPFKVWAGNITVLDLSDKLKPIQKHSVDPKKLADIRALYVYLSRRDKEELETFFDSLEIKTSVQNEEEENSFSSEEEDNL